MEISGGGGRGEGRWIGEIGEGEDRREKCGGGGGGWRSRPARGLRERCCCCCQGACLQARGPRRRHRARGSESDASKMRCTCRLPVHAAVVSYLPADDTWRVHRSGSRHPHPFLLNFSEEPNRHGGRWGEGRKADDRAQELPLLRRSGGRDRDRSATFTQQWPVRNKTGLGFRVLGFRVSVCH